MSGIKYDQDKPDWSLLPLSVLEPTVMALTQGAVKYSRDNWKDVEVDRYVSAMLRHFTAYQSGEINDPESGLPHLSHCIANLTFLIRKGELDDSRHKTEISSGFQSWPKTGPENTSWGLVDRG